MRKKIFIAAAIIILLLLSFFGWLQYRQYSSWKIPVHKDIRDVVRINTDGLIKHFINEYGFNFSKKIKKERNKVSDSAKNTGIYFPGNIFIYTISSRQPTTLFCSLPVYNLRDFKAHIKSRFNIQLSDSAGLSKGTSVDGKITVMCNNDYISLAYSNEKEEVASVLKEILTGEHTLSQHELLTKNLKKEKKLIAGTGASYDFTIDLEDKALLIKASSTQLSKMNFLFSPRQIALNNSSLASFSANIFPQATLFKNEYSVKQYSVATDSVLNYYAGNLNLEIGPSITQVDSITTYEYDDNFEKVEKQTLTEVKVPDIRLSLLMNPGIVQYLQRQNFITPQMKLNKEVFPLFNVAVRMEDSILYFNSSDLNNNLPTKFISSKNFLELNLNVKKTVDALVIPSIHQYISNIRHLKITGQKVQESIVMDVRIDFEHAAIRDIIGIIKSL